MEEIMFSFSNYGNSSQSYYANTLIGHVDEKEFYMFDDGLLKSTKKIDYSKFLPKYPQDSAIISKELKCVNDIIEIPLCPFTKEHVAFFGGKFIENNTPFQFEFPTPVLKSEIGKQYIRDCMLEKDDRKFIKYSHTEILFYNNNVSENGIFIIGKIEKMYVQFCAFIIPPMFGIMLPPDVYYCDYHLYGHFTKIGYNDEHFRYEIKTHDEKDISFKIIRPRVEKRRQLRVY